MPPLPVVVDLHRGSAGEMDGDGLQTSFKHIRDGIADRFGVKDNDPRITWGYSQERTPRHEFWVRITVRSR